jgi:hypothetical protein
MPSFDKGMAAAALFFAIVSLTIAVACGWGFWAAVTDAPGGSGDRWIGIIMCPFFGIPSLYVFFFSIRNMFSPTVDPARPWTVRDDWTLGRVRGIDRTLLCLGLWLVALTWNAISTRALWQLANRTGKAADVSVFAEGLGIAFLLGGLVFAFLALRATARALHYRRSVLILDAIPVVPGGVCTGYIDCAVPSQLEPAFTVALQCTESWSESHGDRSTNHMELLWRDDYECLGLPAEDAPEGSRIPVQFEIPDNAKACGSIGGRLVSWTLRVASSRLGLDFVDEFKMPVFAGDPGSAMVVRERRVPPSAGRQPVHDRVRIEEGAGSVRVVFPPAMNPGFAMIGTGMLIVCGWMTWAYIWQGEILHAMLSSAVVLPSLYAAVRAWFMRTTVIAGSAGLIVEKSLLGLGWKREYNRCFIDSIDVKASGVGDGGVAWYSLNLKVGARKHALGSTMQSKSEAEHIQQLLLTVIDADNTA